MLNRSIIITALLFIITIVTVVSFSGRKAPAVVETNLENLPEIIGNYTGTEDWFPQSVYDELDADKHVYRHYRSPGGLVIDLYIGYYGTAKGGRTGHNPYACLPAAGWAITLRDKVNVAPSYRPDGVELNYVVSSRNNMRNHMLHWYHSDASKVLSSGLEQNLHRFFGRVFRNRNDGAYVQVSIIDAGKDDPEIKDKLKAFAVEVLELLPEYWPNEKDI